MAIKEHEEKIKEGVRKWNYWRKKNPTIKPDLRGIHFTGKNLKGINLDYANLSGARFNGVDLSSSKLFLANLSESNFTNSNLSNSDLIKANFQKSYFRYVNFSNSILRWTNLTSTDFRGARLVDADLRHVIAVRCNFSKALLNQANLQFGEFQNANFSEANLPGANLSNGRYYRARLTGANLTRAQAILSNFRGANLIRANLRDANFDESDFSDSDLSRADMVNVSLNGTILQKCRIFGISAWDLDVSNTKQSDLIITPREKNIITVDNLKIAQFIYLLLNNPEIREVIDTITSKVVLILGRFTPERKVVLDSIRTELKSYNYTPIMFDFTPPNSRDLTETISTLAHLAKFVIADITDAKSIPQELMVIVPHLPSVIIQPLIQKGNDGYGMFEHFKNYQWVMPMYEYENSETIIENIKTDIIIPIENRLLEH